MSACRFIRASCASILFEFALQAASLRSYYLHVVALFALFADYALRLLACSAKLGLTSSADVVVHKIEWGSWNWIGGVEASSTCLCKEGQSHAASSHGQTDRPKQRKLDYSSKYGLRAKSLRLPLVIGHFTWRITFDIISKFFFIYLHQHLSLLLMLATHLIAQLVVFLFRHSISKDQDTPHRHDEIGAMHNHAPECRWPPGVKLRIIQQLQYDSWQAQHQSFDDIPNIHLHGEVLFAQNLEKAREAYWVHKPCLEPHSLS